MNNLNLPRFMNIVVVGNILLCFSMSTACFSEICEKSFPIPVNVDRSYSVPSSMYIKVKHINYDLPFTDFMSKKLSTKEKFVSNIVTCIYQQDFNALSKNVHLTKTEEEDFPDIMKAYGKIINHTVAGNNYEKMKINNQFLLGKDCVFVWEVKSKPYGNYGPLRRPFTIYESSNQQLHWEYKKTDRVKTDRVKNMLVDFMQQNAESPSLFNPKVEVECGYEYLIAGTKDCNPVYIQFNGTRYNHNLLTDVPDPNDEVMRFYQKAHQSLFQDNPKEFAKYYTKMSKEKYLEWIKNMRPEKVQVYLKDMKKGKKIFFIINAEPVYIIFYRPGFRERNIRYDYIIRGRDNAFKLTNFYYRSYFGQFVDEPTLFGKILRSLLASSVQSNQGAKENKSISP